MIKFEEKILVARLARVSSSSRAMFSLCCATRQTTAWEEYAKHFCPDDEGAFKEVVECIWNALGSNVVPLNWTSTLEEVMDLFPGEQSESSNLHAYAEDALASLAYTIRCLIEGSEQEAAWGARRAYETADQAAIRKLGIHPQGAAAEQQILTHLFVQRELERQERDIQTLEHHPFNEVLERLKLSAFSEQALTLDELKAEEG
jgi:uncharacterized protein YjaG (DUF416 family)